MYGISLLIWKGTRHTKSQPVSLIGLCVAVAGFLGNSCIILVNATWPKYVLFPAESRSFTIRRRPAGTERTAEVWSSTRKLH